MYIYFLNYTVYFLSGLGLPLPKKAAAGVGDWHSSYLYMVISSQRVF